MIIVQAIAGERLECARRLLHEYFDWLPFPPQSSDHDAEVAGLPGAYAPPRGRLLLALQGSESAGCVGLRDIGDNICEMKRLYVRPAFRGSGVGRLLVEALVTEASAIGYSRMRLDTVAPHMTAAVALYRSLGFREIAAYNEHSVPGTLFMELVLEGWANAGA